ncbi:SdpI family protein [Galactobacter caseinivorans]|uniref:SdpI family protein n=1 Tax=Galactobacter caseinivorans TaxID=2676123 RepID=A0A496PHD5_9MICC|nr:SdpI family protein [Galactobacter caseinivorans]RKW69870.1 hypothetical protein DWQ67_10355 [Galactobacter caseinivorans]
MREVDLQGLAVGLSAMSVLLFVCLALLASFTKADSLSANRMFGIKTKHTLRSEDAWTAGHLAARTTVLAASICSLGVSVIAVAFILFGEFFVASLIASIGVLLTLIMIGVAAHKANVAAKKAE